jgi:hypothetical protein
MAVLAAQETQTVIVLLQIRVVAEVALLPTLQGIILAEMVVLVS